MLLLVNINKGGLYMGKARKVISFLLLFTLLFSIIFSFSLTAFAKVFTEDTIVEAEDGIFPKGGYGKVRDTEASGNSAFKTMSDGAGKVDDPTVLDMPDAAYEFNISKDGQYDVWALYKALDIGSDSFHYWWNEMPYQTKYQGEHKKYTWIYLGPVNLKAGKNTLNITHCEYGAYFDQFFITADHKCPLGRGALLFNTKNGSVMLEAEEAIGDPNRAEVIREKGASRGSVIKLVKGRKENEKEPSPDINLKGSVEFALKADIDGDYKFWIRYNSINSDTDSAWLSINGEQYNKKALPVNFNEYSWMVYGEVKDVKAGDIIHYKILPREMNAKIDKIIVTASVNYTPEGLGKLPSNDALKGKQNRQQTNKNSNPMPRFFRWNTN